jgi:hypothetical protein
VAVYLTNTKDNVADCAHHGVRFVNLNVVTRLGNDYKIPFAGSSRKCFVAPLQELLYLIVFRITQSGVAHSIAR